MFIEFYARMLVCNVCAVRGSLSTLLCVIGRLCSVTGSSWNSPFLFYERSISLVSSEVASNRYIIYVISLQQTLSTTASLCLLSGGSYRQVALFSSVSSDSVNGQRISRLDDLAFTQTEFGFLVEVRVFGISSKLLRWTLLAKS